MKTIEAKQRLTAEPKTPTIDQFDLAKISQNATKLVASIIGVNPQIKITPSKNPRYPVEVHSADLAHGMKPKIFKSLHIDAFGQGFTEAEGYLWIRLNYSYQHFGNGTNGCEIATTIWKPDGTLAMNHSRIE